MNWSEVPIYQEDTTLVLLNFNSLIKIKTTTNIRPPLIYANFNLTTWSTTQLSHHHHASTLIKTLTFIFLSYVCLYNFIVFFTYNTSIEKELIFWCLHLTFELRIIFYMSTASRTDRLQQRDEMLNKIPIFLAKTYRIVDVLIALTVEPRLQGHHWMDLRWLSFRGQKYN